MPEVKGKANALVGMRRAGKTYLMFSRMSKLLAEGVSKRHMLYLNLEDDRLGEPTTKHLDEALEAFYARTPDSRTQRAYLFLDEIQLVPQWERFVRRVLDTEDVEVMVTGSSAKLLSTEVASALRGRGMAVEVLPFNLREVARAHGFEPKRWPLGARSRSRLIGLADRFQTEGGFPEVRQVDPFDRIQVLQGYVELVLLRDIVERHGVTNLVVLRHLVRALFAANANGLSVSKLHGTLRSQGVRVGKQTLHDYLDHLVDAMLCFLVPIRSRSEKQRIVNPRKVYAVDPGLAAAMATGGAVNTGALLENAVYLELRRRVRPSPGQRIAYHRTGSGFEIDFVVDPIGADSPTVIQVCAVLGDPATRQRELRAIDEAASELSVTEATIVTLHEEDVVQTDAGIDVRVLPFWQWALAPRE